MATTFGFIPAYANRERFNAPLFTTYVFLHIAALAAPFTFSWPGLIVFMAMSFITTCLGITLCYHRLLAHRSYKLPQPLTVFLAFLGCLAYQRGPAWWVATHRLHHSKVDEEGDPHSPRYSFLWAHFLWPFFWHPQLDESEETTRKLARDIYADPGLAFLERHYTTINVLFLTFLFAAGYAFGGWRMGTSLLVWGGFLRIIYVLNCTWLVNSAAHLWGYRTFETSDTSRNNWWVALLTWGEGWHNNHHAHPRTACMGFHWKELDVTFVIIKLLRWAGLATEVNGKPSSAPQALRPIKPMKAAPQQQTPALKS